MANYTYKEIIKELGKHLQIDPHQEIEEDWVSLEFENTKITLTPSKIEGGMVMSLPLALFINTLMENHIHELAISNFLGIETGGTTLYIDEEGILSLKVATSSYTPPEKIGEWIGRLLYTAKEWSEKLNSWEECLPLVTSTPEFKKEQFTKV